MINLNVFFDLLKVKEKFHEKQTEIHYLKMKKIDNLYDFQYINNFDTSRTIGDSLFMVYVFYEMIKVRSGFGLKRLIQNERETIYKQSILWRFSSLYLPILLRLVLVNQLYYMYFYYFVNRLPNEARKENK